MMQKKVGCLDRWYKEQVCERIIKFIFLWALRSRRALKGRAWVRSSSPLRSVFIGILSRLSLKCLSEKGLGWTGSGGGEQLSPAEESPLQRCPQKCHYVFQWFPREVTSLLWRTVTASVVCEALGARLVLSLEEADAGGLCRQQRRQSRVCEGCQCQVHQCLGSGRGAARHASSYSGFGDQPVLR